MMLEINQRFFQLSHCNSLPNKGYKNDAENTAKFAPVEIGLH